MLTAIVGAVLVTTPITNTDPPTVDRVETKTHDNAVEVITYERTGEVYAVLLLQADPDGRVRLDAEFTDALYTSVNPNGEVDTNNGSEAADRVDKITIAIADGAASGDESLWPCAGAIALTVAACLAHPVLCAGEMYFAACECFPKLVDEWKDEEC